MPLTQSIPIIKFPSEFFQLKYFQLLSTINFAIRQQFARKTASSNSKKVYEKKLEKIQVT